MIRSCKSRGRRRLIFCSSGMIKGALDLVLQAHSVLILAARTRSGAHRAAGLSSVGTRPEYVQQAWCHTYEALHQEHKVRCPQNRQPLHPQCRFCATRPDSQAPLSLS